MFMCLKLNVKQINRDGNPLIVLYSIVKDCKFSVNTSLTKC